MSRRICLELGWRRGDESAGVRMPGDKGAAQDIDFAVDRGWSVTDGMEVSIEL